ncbi:MAG TPA: hypothetical protein VMU81_05060 [Acetobacteraceae bacterium]|nr:hypothetical protein [Acetobacteraceae bacterium]
MRSPDRARRPSSALHLPPEPDDPELLDRTRDGWAALSRDLVVLMRYQDFAGIAADQEAASAWLSRRGLVPQQDRMFICPDALPALQGIFRLARPGDVVLSADITYPGARAFTLQPGLTLTGLPIDEEGRH